MSSGLSLYIPGPDLCLAAALLAAYVAGAASVVLVALVWLARRLGIGWREAWGMMRG